MTIRQILKEEIFGDMATVFHRGSVRKLQRLLDKTYINVSRIDFEHYDKALYTTFNMRSQLNTNPDQRNDMKGTYGDYIIKLGIKGVSNFWFCDFDKFKQFHKEANLDNWKELQLQKFNIQQKDGRLLLGKEKEHTANHTSVSKYFEKNNMLGTRVKGIEYAGEYDGECLLIYDWTTAVPLSVTSDEGKTWEKVDKFKTEFQRKNLGNNNFISTARQAKKIKRSYLDIAKNTPKKVNGNFNCSGKDLDSLEGVPEEVSGNFYCINNNLTSLKFAPKKVGGIFYCGNNHLTSLQGASEEVDGDFRCENNELTSLQGAPKKVNRNFNCSNNKLASLQGAPEHVGEGFFCNKNKLASLQGAPEFISGIFDCSNNNLISLQGAPKKVGGGFLCDNNNLTSLKFAPIEVGGTFYCGNNNLTSLEGAPKKCKDLFCSGTKITKEQAVEYLKHNDCGCVNGDGFMVKKSDVVNESYFNY